MNSCRTTLGFVTMSSSFRALRRLTRACTGAQHETSLAKFHARSLLLSEVRVHSFFLADKVWPLNTTLKALNSLICADVPLRNYSLTLQHFEDRESTKVCLVTLSFSITIPCVFCGVVYLQVSSVQ